MNPLGFLVGVKPWNYPYYQLARFDWTEFRTGQYDSDEAWFRRTAMPSGIREDIDECRRTRRRLHESLPVTGSSEHSHRRPTRAGGVALTGSERAGESLAAQAGKQLKKSTMELGGNDAFIVLEDFDPKLAAKYAVQGRMINAGQACVGSKRFIAVDAMADEFLAEVMKLLAGYIPGDPTNEATTLAPFVFEDRAEQSV